MKGKGKTALIIVLKETALPSGAATHEKVCHAIP